MPAPHAHDVRKRPGVQTLVTSTSAPRQLTIDLTSFTEEQVKQFKGQLEALDLARAKAMHLINAGASDPNVTVATVQAAIDRYREAIEKATVTVQDGDLIDRVLSLRDEVQLR